MSLLLLLESKMVELRSGRSTEAPADDVDEAGTGRRAHGSCFWTFARTVLSFMAALPPRERVVAVSIVAALSLSSYAFIMTGFKGAINGTLDTLCSKDFDFDSAVEGAKVLLNSTNY